MERKTFRQKSVDRVSSPEQLNDYLHVTTPAVWVVLAAVCLLLLGLLIWGNATAINSYAAGTAEVRDGILTITFDDAEKAKYVEAGMNVTVGDLVTPILSVGEDDDGTFLATANADLSDGRYHAKVGYKKMQIISLLVN